MATEPEPKPPADPHYAMGVVTIVLLLVLAIIGIGAMVLDSTLAAEMTR